MKDILIYTKPNCPYCDKAKSLLSMKKAKNIREIDISSDESQREKMIEQAGGRKTVPQIFIGERHIGGFDDLDFLNQQGELDKLL